MSNTNCPNCPKCYSSNVVSNRKANHHTDHSAMHTTTHLRHGHPLASALIGGFYLIARAVDALSEKYKCKSCEHTFS